MADIMNVCFCVLFPHTLTHTHAPWTWSALQWMTAWTHQSFLPMNATCLSWPHEFSNFQYRGVVRAGYKQPRQDLLTIFNISVPVLLSLELENRRTMPGQAKSTMGGGWDRSTKNERPFIIHSPLSYSAGGAGASAEKFQLEVGVWVCVCGPLLQNSISLWGRTFLDISS